MCPTVLILHLQIFTCLVLWKIACEVTFIQIMRPTENHVIVAVEGEQILPGRNMCSYSVTEGDCWQWWWPYWKIAGPSPVCSENVLNFCVYDLQIAWNIISEIIQFGYLLNTSLKCYAMPVWSVMEVGCLIYLWLMSDMVI
jgi:hypothetical protein